MLARLYKNTGFNIIDIPDSPHFFENRGIQPDWEFNNIEILQINNIAKLTLEMNEWDGRSVDYVILIDTNVNYDKNYACYTVDGILMQAPGVCTFTLIEDSFNTLGGFSTKPEDRSGNEIIGGSANRLSVSLAEDDIHYFNESEPFAPSEACRVDTIELNSTTQESEKILELAAIPPKQVEFVIQVNTGTDVVSPTDPDTKVRIAMPSNATRVPDTEVIGQQDIKVETTEEKYHIIKVKDAPKFRLGIDTAIQINKPDGNGLVFHAGTTLFIKDFSRNWSVTLPDGSKYDLLKDLMQYDMLDSVIGYWEVPKEYIDLIQIPDNGQYNVSEDSAGISGISNKVFANSITIEPVKIKLFNKKAQYGQSRTLKVYCPASGESLDKSTPEITNSLPKDNPTIEWVITSDIRRGGSPIFMWKYIAPGNSQLSHPIEYIKGRQWRNITLRMTGVQGEYFEKLQLDMQSKQVLLGALTAGIGAARPNIRQVQRQQDNTQLEDLFTLGTTAQPAAQTSLALTGNPWLGLGVAAGVAINGLYAIHQQNQLLNARGASAGSTVQVGDSDFFREAKMNTFHLAVCSYSERDLKDFDTFLTRYGYAVNNRTITNDDLYSRPAFNFVRVNDLSIRSIGGNINLINRTINQMKNGVRIWHKIPNQADMLAGGNR